MAGLLVVAARKYTPFVKKVPTYLTCLALVLAVLKIAFKCNFFANLFGDLEVVCPHFENDK